MLVANTGNMGLASFCKIALNFSPVDKLIKYNFYNFGAQNIHSSDNETVYGHKKYPG